MSASTSNFDFLKQFFQTKIIDYNFQMKIEKMNITTEFLILEIVLVSNFTFNFGTKFAQNRYFWSKTEKVNIILEFCIFELV